MKSVCVVYCVASLVPKDTHAFFISAALDFKHLAALKLHQSRVCEIKRYGETRDPVRREPFLAHPGVRLEPDVARFEFSIEALDAVFKRRAFQAQPQIAKAHVEQLFIGQ